MNSPDTRYDYTDPDFADEQPGPRYDYMGPFATKEQELISRAILPVVIPAVQLADLVRPPLPQVYLFPPKLGYRTRQIGIADLMNIDELYAEPPKRYDAADQGWEGTLRNAQGNNSW